MNEPIEFIKSNVKSNDTLVLAISGGPDSMALLDLISKLKDELNINIIVAHVNHNVRIESDKEQLDLDSYCKKHNITFECIKIENWSNGNFEEEARKVRYEFFEKLIKKYNAQYLLTAHHGDDLVESILMRIVRGSSLKGYAGFERVVDKSYYKILRPFITLTKEDLVNYCNEFNISYAIDKTNFTDEHTRNRYRKYILPRLKQENSNVHLKFYSFSKQLLEYDNYFKALAKKELDNVYNDNRLNLLRFNLLDNIVQKYIVNLIFESVYNDLSIITNKHVDMFYNLINSNKPNTYIKLPNNIIIKKEYDYVVIDSIKNNTDYEYELKDEIVINNKTIKIISKTDSNSNYYTKLNTKDIKLPLYVRNRRTGDRFTVKNMEGSKKIKDIFIDCKLTKDQRDSWPIVVDSNNNIVWIPGIKKSNYDTLDYDLVLEYK